MQAVGELYQQDADILGHGEDQLAEVFRLFRLVGIQLDLAELGNPLDQIGHLIAKQLADLRVGSLGVLNRVVEQCGNDRGSIKPHLGQDTGDF